MNKQSFAIISFFVFVAFPRAEAASTVYENSFDSGADLAGFTVISES